MRSYTSIGFYYDQRRPLKDNTFPLKLRVTFQRKTKYFDIGFSMTQEEYDSVFRKKSPRGYNKTLKDKVSLIEQKAKDIVANLKEFSFEEFEKLFYQKRIDSENVVFYFLNRMKEFESNGQMSSLEAYRNALNKIYFTTFPAKSPQEEREIKRKETYRIIPFNTLNVDKLKKLEKTWTEHGLSPATQGIYFRNLRAVFNYAIENNIIAKELYPFGKGKFQIQQFNYAKKFLTIDELRELDSYEVSADSVKEFAKEWWFLSFYLHGMNLNDLLQLRQKNYEGAKIYFVRGKTSKTTRNVKEQHKEVIKKAAEIIKKHRSHSKNPDDYLFPYLDKTVNAAERRTKIKNFTRKVNNQLDNIRKDLGWEKKLTTYSARHSFASIVADKNISLPALQEALGHGSILTTQSYIASIRSNFGEEFYSDIF